MNKTGLLALHSRKHKRLMKMARRLTNARRTFTWATAADFTGTGMRAVRKRLDQLVEAGILLKRGKRYRLADAQ